MPCILILRTQADSNQPQVIAETFYAIGAGFLPTRSAASPYASKEAALADGVAQAAALGPGARLVIKDTTTGTEWAVPRFAGGPFLASLTIAPTSPGVTAGGTLQMIATGRYDDGTTADLTHRINWTSATPSRLTIGPDGMLFWVSPGTSVISASLSGIVAATTATAA